MHLAFGLMAVIEECFQITVRAQDKVSQKIICPYTLINEPLELLLYADLMEMGTLRANAVYR
jgi:hypothetical protein